MQILIIINQYHPALNPNVYRWSAIAEHWVKQGHGIHVLCTVRKGISNKTLWNDVIIHRAGQNSLLDWTYNIMSVKQRRGEAGGDKMFRNGKLRQFLELIVDWSWRLVYWPDGSCFWYLPARKKATQLIENQKFDAIISVGLPFTAHLIGLHCKKRFPHIKWLMDIEDPFSFVKELFINNKFLYSKANHAIEKKALQLSDKVVVTVDSARSKYIKAFPFAIEKISVIPPVYSLPEISQSIHFEQHKTHIGYFGSFYYPIRKPDVLLEIFKQISLKYDTYVLHFFGEIAPVFKPIFGKYNNLDVRLHGLTSRALINAAMRAMDFLVNVSNSTDYHIPSKSIDYYVSGKPIINLYNNHQDPILHFFDDYPYIKHLKVDSLQPFESAAIEDIIRFMEANKGVLLDESKIEKAKELYGIEAISQQYIQLLQH